VFATTLLNEKWLKNHYKIDMETKVISCDQDLMNKIAALKVLKSEQEAKISYQFNDLKNSLNIGTIIKESVAHIASDKDTKKDLLKIGTTMGTNFLIEKVLGSNSSIKGFLGSMLAEKVSNTFIGKLISKI
jgi:hypothetical protein